MVRCGCVDVCVSLEHQEGTDWIRNFSAGSSTETTRGSWCVVATGHYTATRVGGRARWRRAWARWAMEMRCCRSSSPIKDAGSGRGTARAKVTAFLQLRESACCSSRSAAATIASEETRPQASATGEAAMHCSARCPLAVSCASSPAGGKRRCRLFHRTQRTLLVPSGVHVPVRVPSTTSPWCKCAKETLQAEYREDV